VKKKRSKETRWRRQGKEGGEAEKSSNEIPGRQSAFIERRRKKRGKKLHFFLKKKVVQGSYGITLHILP
jgi:hypothetical protein